MKVARYAVQYEVTFGARSYPSRVRDTVTNSTVTSAGKRASTGRFTNMQYIVTEYSPK